MRPTSCQRAAAHPPRPRATAQRVVAALTALAFLLASGCASNSMLSGASGGDGKSGSGESSQKSGSTTDKTNTNDSSREGGSSHTRSNSEGSSNDGKAASAAVSWVLLGAVVVAVVIWLVFYATTEPEQKEAQAYLEAQRRSIRVSLARGSGPFIQNVAMVLGVPSAELPTLAGAIHARRDALDRWLVLPNLSEEDARGFSADLLEALMAEPRLVPRVEAARERISEAFSAGR